MTPQQIAVLVVAATLGLLLLLLLLYGRPRRTLQEPMPANFYRGDADSVLEGPRLDKMLRWGFASAVFCTGFLAVYLVAEPFREARYEKRFHDRAVERGKHEFLEGVQCAGCHGPNGEGGFAATDTAWPAPPLNNVLQRYTRQEVKRIIEMGRTGTPMPAWGVSFGGPLNDQKVDDVLLFLQTIQVPAEEKFELPSDLRDGSRVFAQKCAVCHGQNARGQAMGKPLPTFYAADLTTEFYRLGVKVLTDRKRDPARVPLAEIVAAGEEAARNTIEKGRPNTPMPAWKNRIGPDQITAVLEYLRTIQRQPS